MFTSTFDSRCAVSESTLLQVDALLRRAASPKSGWQHVVQGSDHYASGTQDKEDQPRSCRSSRSITLQKPALNHIDSVLMCIPGSRPLPPPRSFICQLSVPLSSHRGLYKLDGLDMPTVSTLVYVIMPRNVRKHIWGPRPRV